MCFTKEMSLSFAMLGLFMSYWAYSRTGNKQLAIGIFYFFLMEFLQFFQYLFIDDCDNKWNQILTVVGYAHICYQPYFTHIINCSLTRSKTTLSMFVAILRLTLIGGTLLFLRWVATYYITEREHFNDDHLSTEWLRGEKLCTMNGKYHLAWSIPMVDVSYYVPSAAIHSFCMFAPFLVVKTNMVVQGFFLWLTGPYLAAYITGNLMEQASIWCFFSICQIGFMLLIIRSVVIKPAGDDMYKPPYIDLSRIWPMGIIDPNETKTAGAKAKKAAEAAGSDLRRSKRTAKKVASTD